MTKKKPMILHKHFLAVCFLTACFLVFTVSAFAQVQDPEAKAILDKVSAKYKALSAFQVEFTRTLKSNNDEVLGTQTGNITVSGVKFRMKVDDLEVFCDGKTLWTYMKDVNEVNVSNYEKDGEEITPTTIYEIYKKGYKYVLYGTNKINGKTAHTMDLEPLDNKKEIVKIRLWVEKSSNEILQWIAYERGSNDRQVFEVKKFLANVPVKPSDFSFKASNYPGVSVVDLR